MNTPDVTIPSMNTSIPTISSQIQNSTRQFKEVMGLFTIQSNERFDEVNENIIHVSNQLSQLRQHTVINSLTRDDIKADA